MSCFWGPPHCSSTATEGKKGGLNSCLLGPLRLNNPGIIFSPRITGRARELRPSTLHTGPWLTKCVRAEEATHVDAWLFVQMGGSLSTLCCPLTPRSWLQEMLISPCLSWLATSAVNPRPCKVYSSARPRKHRRHITKRNTRGIRLMVIDGHSHGLAWETDCIFNSNRFQL